jgi:hypothetical protein
MKRTVSIALALTLILVVVGVTVWAGPGRQGTVPTPPEEVDLVPDEPVALGTVEITPSCIGTAIRVEDPEEEFGPAPDDLEFLADGVTVVFEEECEVKVCYPYPEDTEEKDGQIYKWDDEAEEWELLESTISGDPKKICAVDEKVTDGTYALIGE